MTTQSTTSFCFNTPGPPAGAKTNCDRQLCERRKSREIFAAKRSTDVALHHSVLSKLRFLTAHATRSFMPLYWRLSRGLTLGVRGLVFDAQARVFLVNPPYVHWWLLPP